MVKLKLLCLVFCPKFTVQCFLMIIQVYSPSINKRKFQVVSQEMLLCELVKSVDSLAEGAGMLDMFPRQCGQARCEMLARIMR